MGFGYVASPHNYYEGRLKLGGSKDIETGTFVVADYKTGTAEPKAATDIKLLYFVAQENDTPIEYGLNDLDQKVKSGAYLKLAKLQRDMVLKTTEVTGEISVGDFVKVQDDGTLKKDELGNTGVILTVIGIETVGTSKVYVVKYLV